MATLKSIVTEYINLLDKPFDTALYRRVRQIILNQRAFEINKLALRYGIDNTLIQYIRPTFEKVSDTLGVAISDDEVIIKTTNKVLRSKVSLSREAIFHYVGSNNLTLPFLELNNKNLIHSIKNSKHTNRLPLYYVEDGDVYCVCKKGTKDIAIGHVWLDHGKIDLMNDAIEDEYFDDEYEFLIAPEMLQIIKERLIKGELGVLKTDDKEVKLDGEEQSNSQ